MTQGELDQGRRVTALTKLHNGCYTEWLPLFISWLFQFWVLFFGAFLLVYSCHLNVAVWHLNIHGVGTRGKEKEKPTGL